MHGHSQNLNEKGMGVTGPKWVHGRAWLRGGEDSATGFFRSCRAHAEWGFGKWARSLGVEMRLFGEDYDVSFHVGITRLFSLWLDFGVLDDKHYKRMPKWVQDAVYGCHGYCVFEVKWQDGYISLCAPCDDSCTTMDHKDRHLMIEPLAKIFGSWKYERTPVKKVSVDIPMPEGTYPAEITFERCEKRWKRWPWPTEVFTTASIEIKRGGDIMCPKGLYSMSTSARTVAEAVAKVVEMAIRDRGGTSWRPPTNAVRELGNAICRQ